MTTFHVLMAMAMAIIFIFPTCIPSFTGCFLFVAFVFCERFALELLAIFFHGFEVTYSVDDSHSEHQFEGAVLIKFFGISLCVVLVVQQIFSTVSKCIRSVVGHLQLKCMKTVQSTNHV